VQFIEIADPDARKRAGPMTTPNDEMPDRVAMVRALRAIGRDPKALAFMTPSELQLAPPTLTDYNSQQHDVTTPGRFLAHTDLMI
jgi:hypothetical protein